MGANRSLPEFRRMLGLTRALLTLERRRYSDPPPSSQQQVVMGLRGAAAVLMVAAFEFYIRRAVEEHIDLLRRHPRKVQFARLPDDMRVRSVYSSLDRAMKGPSFEESLPKRDRLSDIERACSLILAGTLDPSTFSDIGGSPSSRRLKEICKCLGDSGVFVNIKQEFQTRWGNPVAGTFVEDKLDEVVRRRHSVAHSASVLNITRVDLAEGVRFVDVLAGAFAAELRRQRGLLVRAST